MFSSHSFPTLHVLETKFRTINLNLSFQIEREVILSSTDKNSKIPILHDYMKKTKSSIAPDVPPKQMSAWSQGSQQSQILNAEQVSICISHKKSKRFTVRIAIIKMHINIWNLENIQCDRKQFHPMNCPCARSNLITWVALCTLIVSNISIIFCGTSSHKN